MRSTWFPVFCNNKAVALQSVKAQSVARSEAGLAAESGEHTDEMFHVKRFLLNSGVCFVVNRRNEVKAQDVRQRLPNRC